MPLKVVRQDITKMEVDAIVNAANRSLLGGSGVDGAIHRAAGPELLDECRKLNGCNVGEAKLTRGYGLQAKYVIHTVGPIWEGGGHHEKALLTNCYKNALMTAVDHHLESIAFPLISSGAYGYPKNDALRVAIDAISEFLMEHDLEVSLVLFNQDATTLSKRTISDIRHYIGDGSRSEKRARENRIPFEELLQNAEAVLEDKKALLKKERSLQDVVNELDETFQEKLFRWIDQKGLTDTYTYRKANLDRKLFSKIRCDKDYRPSKATALSLALSMELSLDETMDLLGAAGMTLSKSFTFDLIIMYFIERQIYDIFRINEALYEICKTTL